MIATYYGLKQPLAKYRELTKTDKTGTSLYGLIEGARKIGFYAEALSGSPDELMKELNEGTIKLPVIAHIVSDNAMFHFVVIFQIKDQKVLVGDPGTGRCIWLLNDFFEKWTGYLIKFKVTDEFQPGNYVRGSFCKFFGLLKGQYLKLCSILIISLIIASIGIMGAFVFELVIDNFAVNNEWTFEETHEHTDEEHRMEEETEQTEQNPLAYLLEFIAEKVEVSHFHLIFLVVIGLYVLQAMIQLARGYLIISVSRKIDLRLTLSYYKHIIGLPVSEVSVRQTGEYLSRFSDAANIRNAISGATLTLVLDSVMVIACGIILYSENQKLFFLALLLVVVYAFLVLIYRKPVENANRTVMENSAVVQSYLKESIDGIETVKSVGAEKEISRQMTEKFHHFIDAVVKNSFISISQDTLVDMVEMIGRACILWCGFTMVLSGQVTIGSLMTFYVLLEYFTIPIKNLIELQPTIQTAFVAADRLNDILELEEEALQLSGEEIPKINAWEFRNIDFRYGNRKLTLENINIQIKRGQKVAIVGESGSGKTTLVKLLLRFYEPESGEIMANDKNIADFDLSVFRNSIAYIGQNPFLFSDTIKNNLKLGSDHVTDEEIKQVCKMSKADEFIKELPLGYDTPLDENGMNLSGGQRQRLSIARALLKKSQLLILDEATSHLDTITEASIKDMIFQDNPDLTCIIIAHRLSTVKQCDCIYVLEQGKIVEAGKHAELMQEGKKYKALWNAQ